MLHACFFVPKSVGEYMCVPLPRRLYLFLNRKRRNEYIDHTCALYLALTWRDPWSTCQLCTLCVPSMCWLLV